MRDTELKRKKVEALYSVYKQGLQEGRFTSLNDAGRIIAASPAPSFFVSAKYASLLLGRINAKHSLINLHASTRKLAWRLWFNYTDYLNTHPDNTLSRERILESLVEEPAPEFYTSTQSVRKHIKATIKNIRREKGWGD